MFKVQFVFVWREFSWHFSKNRDKTVRWNWFKRSFKTFSRSCLSFYFHFWFVMKLVHPFNHSSCFLFFHQFSFKLETNFSDFNSFLAINLSKYKKRRQEEKKLTKNILIFACFFSGGNVFNLEWKRRISFFKFDKKWDEKIIYLIFKFLFHLKHTRTTNGCSTAKLSKKRFQSISMAGISVSKIHFVGNEFRDTKIWIKKRLPFNRLQW